MKDRTMKMTIKDARTKLGWTQERLASEIGVTRQTVSNLEAGRVTPSMHKLVSMVLSQALANHTSTPSRRQSSASLSSAAS